MNEWQPIATAPIEDFKPKLWYERHSPPLLLWTGWCEVGSYGYTERGKGRWRGQHGRIITPSYWMPLPEPPTSTRTSASEEPK